MNELIGINSTNTEDRFKLGHNKHPRLDGQSLGRGCFKSLSTPNSSACLQLSAFELFCCRGPEHSIAVPVPELGTN
eukprot:4284755-Amphidinium_carterae.1